MDSNADQRLAETLARDGTVRADRIDAALKTQVDLRRRGEEVPLADVLQRENALPEGRRFGPYILLKQLGKGGMGVVWKAWDSRLGRPVALKQILGEDPTDAEQVPRFMAEARASARLHHPNIVGLYDIGVESGKHYFTMDFVEGASLKDAAAERLSPRRALEIARDVARALHYAHQQGIVHRDIKPANILLDAAGTPFITDFGLAKDVSRAAGAGLTLSGQLLGTPNYLSPEQARGSAKSVGPAGDQFSLGVTLYELLSRRLPFSGEGIHDLLDAVVNKEASSLGPGIHRDIETIVHKALEKDPARRYATLNDFADDIHRYLEGEPILARRISGAARLWRRAVKHKAVTLPTVAALVIALAFGAYALVTALQKSDRIRATLREAAGAEASDPDEAHKRYAAVIGLDPDNPDARAGIARIDARRRDEARDLEKRERDATALIEAGRPALDKATSYLYKDVSYKLLLDQVEFAQTKLGEALKLKPDSPLIHTLLGRAWQLKGFDDKAEAAFRTAVELDPNFGPARFQLGLLLVFRAFCVNARVAVRERTLDRAIRYVKESTPIAAEGQKEILAAGELGGFENEIEQKIAEFLVAYTRVPPDLAKLVKKPGEAATAFVGRDGAEVLLWVNSFFNPDARQANLDQALAIRPKFAEARFFRGYLRAVARNPRAAIEDFSVAIELRPREPLFYVVRADSYEASGDPTQAFDDYSRAMELDPTYDHAFISRALLRYRTGDYKGAISDYDEIIRANRKYEASHLMRGCASLALNDFDRAVEDLRQAVKIQGAFDPQGHYFLGLALAGAGDGPGAVVAFNDALLRDARHEQSAFQKGILCSKIQRHEEAADALLRALAVAPDRWKDRDAAIAELDRLTLDPASAAGARVRAFQTGDAATALAELDKAVELDPRSVDAHAERAVALLALNRAPDALITLNTALLIQAKDPTLLLLRSRTHRALSDPAKALIDALAAADSCRDDPTMFVELALVDIAKNDPKGAILSLERALELHPDYLPALVERAEARLDLKDADGALDDADRIMKIDPDNVRALNSRGRAYLVKKNWDLAVADFSKLVTLNPKAYWGLYNRGLAQNGKRNFDAALSDFDAALRLAPDYDKARFDRGSLLRSLGRYNAAVDDWNLYLTRIPENAAALNNRALALHESGESARALPDYDAALALSPGDTIILGNRAGAREAVGDLKGALEDLDRLVSLKPSDAWTRQRRGALRLKADLLPDRALEDFNALIAAGKPSASLLTQRASAYKRDGKLDLALADLDEAVKLRSDDVDARLLRARVLTLRNDPNAALKDLDALPKSDFLSPESFLLRGLALKRKGDLVNAAGMFYLLLDVVSRPVDFAGVVRAALDELPKDVPSNALMDVLELLLVDDIQGALAVAEKTDDRGLVAYAHLLARNFDRAAAACDEAVKQTPEVVDLLLLRARIRIEQNDPVAALSDLKAVLKADPLQESARYYLAKAHDLAGDTDAALAEYDAAIRLNTLNARAHNNRGNLRETLGDDAGALEDFTRALTDDPRLPQPYANRARLRARRGDVNGALDDFDRAVKLRPADLGRRLDRADLRLRKGDAPGALADCDAVLAVEPANVDALFTRARARHVSGDLDGSISDNTEVLRLSPGSVNALFNRGLARLQKPDPAGAVDDFTRFIDRVPDAPAAYLHRARARVAAGDKPAAVSDFEKALALASADWPERAAAEAELLQAREE